MDFAELERSKDSARNLVSFLRNPTLVALSCLLASVVGETLFLGPGALPVFLPADGVLLASLLLTASRDWPSLLVAGLLADLASHLVFGRSLPATLVFGFGTAIASLSAAATLRYLGPRVARFAERYKAATSHEKGTSAQAAATAAAPPPTALAASSFGDGRVLDSMLGISFLFASAMAGAAIGAAIGAPAQGLAARGARLAPTFASRMTAESLGMTVVAPFLLAWRGFPTELAAFARKRRPLPPIRWEPIGEAFLVALLLGTGIYIMFDAVGGSPFARDFLVVPFVVWAALRHGLRGAAFANLATALAALIAAIPLLPHPGSFEGIKFLVALDLQSFLTVVSITSLFLAASMVERSRKEKDLRLALADRELLLMEIEHRVKNNLSVVTSVLRLGRSDVEDDRASKILLEAETRIRSMALMYERLYDSKSLADVELGVYVRKLGAQLMKAYAVSSNIALDVVSDEIHMDMKRVVPLGLILNELITNALKYAFPGGQGGIRIELRRSESRISVRVSDNGVGFPADFRAERTGGVGYKLVLMLTAQLKGEIATGKREGGAGASTTLAFPL